jgi:hypothetical protein
VGLLAAILQSLLVQLPSASHYWFYRFIYLGFAFFHTFVFLLRHVSGWFESNDFPDGTHVMAFWCLVGLTVLSVCSPSVYGGFARRAVILV